MIVLWLIFMISQDHKMVLWDWSFFFFEGNGIISATVFFVWGLEYFM